VAGKRYKNRSGFQPHGYRQERSVTVIHPSEKGYWKQTGSSCPASTGDFELRIEYNTKADVVVAVVGVVVVTVSGAAVPGVVVPVAAAQHAVPRSVHAPPLSGICNAAWNTRQFAITCGEIASLSCRLKK
jgi:hypothetical protein